MKRLIWNKHTKLILKHLVGWLFIVAGLIMLITPGQGILSILIGVYMLADHVPAFGKLRDRIHQKFPKCSEFVHHKIKQLKARFHKDLS